MPSSLQIVQSLYPQVKHIVRSKKGLDVKVSNQDAQLSKRKDHHGCAMALACKRQFDVDGAIISTRTAYLVKGDTATHFAVGSAVAREITSFDRGAGFAPGEYMLLKSPKPLPRGSGTRHAGNPAAGKLKHRAYKHVEGTRDSLAAFAPKKAKRARK